MKKRIIELLNQGRPYSEIVERVGCSKATISYHAKRIGKSHGRKPTYDWKEIQSFYDAGHSYRECKQKFGFASQSWQKAKERGEITVRERTIPLSELMRAGRQTAGYHLRGRLIKENVLENRCARCGINEWLGQPLQCQLHHKNGVGQDNRLSNLEMLCPNCHSQTDSWCGKNIASARKRRIQKSIKR